jgi:hypothetical protein
VTDSAPVSTIDSDYISPVSAGGNDNHHYRRRARPGGHHR